jgi:ADP-glucose pyrophosphorylase
MAYDFILNEIPGNQAHEKRGDWRDIGTIDACFEAPFDTPTAQPQYRMTNKHWPIFAGIGGDLERDRNRSHVSEAGIGVGPRRHFGAAAAMQPTDFGPGSESH